MQYIVTPAQMRLLDAHMIEQQHIPGVVLMEHAALGVVEAVISLMPAAGGAVCVICGGGNNGGDGLAVLRYLCMRGVEAWAALLCAPETLKGDARLQYDMAVSCGLMVRIALTQQAVSGLPINDAVLIVDALLGTGLRREVAGNFLSAVQRVNAAGVPVVAVDIPSGVDGATGLVCGEAVQASCTVTFQHKKIGHMLMPGRIKAGEVRVAPIGLPALRLYEAEQWEKADVQALLPPRRLDSHKGKNGRALLFAGSERYTGASTLCASSALRAGCGLLYVAVPRGIHAAFHCPAAISMPVGKTADWSERAALEAMPLLQEKHAIALGPGMGSGVGVAMLLEKALQCGKPMVVDADALNALSDHRGLFPLLHECVVLTPHPGEMARLLQGDAADIARNPLQYAKQAAEAWGCTVLLKGATTVIAHNKRVCLNTTGNPGLAKGGSGDVLSGILLGLLAQGFAPYDAACVGAYLLGESAESALSILGTRALLPTDVMECFSIHSTD